jgi:hypothetical protein
MLSNQFLSLKGKGKEITEALRQLFAFLALRSRDAKFSPETISKMYVFKVDIRHLFCPRAYLKLAHFSAMEISNSIFMSLST